MGNRKVCFAPSPLAGSWLPIEAGQQVDRRGSAWHCNAKAHEDAAIAGDETPPHHTACGSDSSRTVIVTKPSSRRGWAAMATAHGHQTAAPAAGGDPIRFVTPQAGLVERPQPRTFHTGLPADRVEPLSRPPRRDVGQQAPASDSDIATPACWGLASNGVGQPSNTSEAPRIRKCTTSPLESPPAPVGGGRLAWRQAPRPAPRTIRSKGVLMWQGRGANDG